MARITIIAIGTRGDAQPAVALGKGLQSRGHYVRVLAGANFSDWIAEHGLDPAASSVDIQALMESEDGQEWVERGHNPIVQTRLMKKLVDQTGEATFKDAWEACQDVDALISGFTSDVYAVSIAEKLNLKHISIPVQPSVMATRDGRALMNAPLPNRKSIINYLFGKAMIEPSSWLIYGEVANRLRQDLLALPPQSGKENWQARRRMFVVHGYSRHVVPHPADWPDNFHTVGYWFLEDAGKWQPPKDLLRFLEEGKQPISIGFGSMTGREPQKMTELIIEAVRQSGQRAVLLAGWASIGDAQLTDSIFRLSSAPHNWLFSRMVCVVHHGGAGTTAAGLRAGVPSVIVPHFVDQPFWGKRVHALGVGPKPIPRRRLSAAGLAKAIQTAVTDPAMRQRAADLGEEIRAEDGIGIAADLIEQELRQ